MKTAQKLSSNMKANNGVAFLVRWACKSHREIGSQETLSYWSEHLSGLEGANCLCVALCGLSLCTHCALSCTGCIFSGHSGCLEGFVFSLVFDSKYCCCCCCCKPPAVMSKAPLCLELTVHEKSSRQLSCLTFISNSSGVELPVLSITGLEVY